MTQRDIFCWFSRLNLESHCIPIIRWILTFIHFLSNWLSFNILIYLMIERSFLILRPSALMHWRMIISRKDICNRTIFSYLSTMFENYPKMSHEFFNFSIFRHFLLTDLVTLSPNWVGIFDEYLSFLNVNGARFARNISKWDFFSDFYILRKINLSSKIELFMW